MPSEGKQHKDFKKAHPEAVVKLLSPDGYYTYLGVTRPKPTESDPNPPIDEETVKKSYRRLSLRHHPDRPTGDDETFRVLNRAQKVLLNPKLRQQYDLLGLDLDDEDEEHHHDEDHTTEGNDEGKEGDDSSGNGGSSSNSNGSPEGIVSQLASVTLASIFQIVVRTAMMAFVACILVRWRITLIPALCFLAFVAYRIHTLAQSNPAAGDMMSPLIIGVALILMHRGRTAEDPWSWGFWAGETLVMIMFIYNSMPHKTPAISTIVALCAILLTLWLRGNPWKYATVLGLELFVALVAALAFPIMEMILEQILNEKMRRVGEKVRAHAKRLDEYYGRHHGSGGSASEN